MSENDAWLVESFLDGDAETAELVSAWIRVSTLSFRRRLGSDWEDAHQEALTQLTRALRSGRFRGEGSFKAYVRRIANTTCLDRVRSRSRWRWVELDDNDLPFAAESPERQIAARDVHRVVGQVLEAVPESCRKLWSMIVAGLGYREMSQQLGVAEGTLRVQVLRCRRRALEVRDQLLGNMTEPQTP